MLDLKKGRSLIPTEAIAVLIHISYVVLSFLTGIILARTLGPESFGHYSYLISWVVLIISFITAGLPVLLVREISAYKQNKEHRLIRGIIYCSLLFVAFFFLLVVVGILIVDSLYELDTKFILPILGALFFLPYLAIYEAAMRGLGHVFLGELSSKVISPFLSVILISSLVLYSYDEAITVKNVLYLYSFVSFVGAIIIYLIFHRKMKSFYFLEREYQLIKWFSSLWKISLVGWFGALNIQLSFILLGYFGKIDDVAQYKVAAQIASLIPFGLMVINSIQMPELSKAFHNDEREELQRLANRSCIISTLLGIPIILIALFFGESFIAMLFGSGYQNASTILLILAVGQIINVSAGSTGLLMLVSRKEHIVIMNQGFVLFLNISFCIILIPIIGALGAALASSISQAFRNIFLIVYLYRKMRIISLPRIWHLY